MRKIIMTSLALVLCVGFVGTSLAADMGRFCWQTPSLFMLDVAITQQTAPGAVQQLGFSGTLSNPAGVVIGYATGSGAQDVAAGTINAGLIILTDPASAFAAGTSSSVAVCSFTLPALGGACSISPSNGAIPVPVTPIAFTAVACP